MVLHFPPVPHVDVEGPFIVSPESQLNEATVLWLYAVKSFLCLNAGGLL